MLAQVSNKDGVVVDAGFSTRGEREVSLWRLLCPIAGSEGDNVGRRKGGGNVINKAKMEQTLEKWPKRLSPKK